MHRRENASGGLRGYCVPGGFEKAYATRGFSPREKGTASERFFYTRDHLGSVIELTDSAQNVQARYAYDPYGVMTQVSGSRTSSFGYAGMFWHGQSSLNLTLYRAYDPNLGRWISRDPITDPLVFSRNSEGGEFGDNLKVPDLINIDQTNEYCYISNSVISGFDPLGLKCTKIGSGVVRYDYIRWKQKIDITWMSNLLGGKYLGPIGSLFSLGCKIFNVTDMESFVAKIKTTYWCDGQCGDPLGLKFEFGPPDTIVRPISSYLKVECGGADPAKPPPLKSPKTN